MVKPQNVKAWASPGHGPLQELALAAHLGQLGPDPGRERHVKRPGSGLARPDQAEEKEEPAAGDGQGDDRHSSGRWRS